MTSLIEQNGQSRYFVFWADHEKIYSTICVSIGHPKRVTDIAAPIEPLESLRQDREWGTALVIRRHWLNLIGDAR